jgi:DNA-binding LacI/PurR family transcriptional regulator
VFCDDDVLAGGVYLAARERGVRIPEDLSVVGFDDLPAAAGAGLTTVRQPLADKGRLAARLLLDLLTGAPARRVELPTALVVRGSTATPPRDGGAP